MRFLIALLGLAAALTCNAQAVVWPSTSTSCSGSLQACVNAQPAYFTVIIATDTVGNVGGEGVGGALNLPRSIWLVAADGYHPQFPIGVGIQSLMSGTTLIQIQDLMEEARLRLIQALRRMRFSTLLNCFPIRLYFAIRIRFCCRVCGCVIRGSISISC